jgi:hypothetical protein
VWLEVQQCADRTATYLLKAATFTEQFDAMMAWISRFRVDTFSASNSLA